MRTRINNITFTSGTRSINTGITSLTIDDIRLIVTESQNKVICSSMQKDNIVSISSGVVTYKDTFPVLASGDHITFEIDKGDNGAKEATSLEILSGIGDLNDKISPYLYDECSVEDINHIFETILEDGYVFIPSNAINSNGTMPIAVFGAITDFTLE